MLHCVRKQSDADGHAFQEIPMFKKLLALMLALFTSLAFALDVNSADVTQLDGVKGIGPAIAGKIVDARKAGPFKDWNDLVGRVSGIGEASAAKLSAAGLTVNGAAFKGAPAAVVAPKVDKADKAVKAATAKAEKAVTPAVTPAAPAPAPATAAPAPVAKVDAAADKAADKAAKKAADKEAKAAAKAEKAAAKKADAEAKAAKKAEAASAADDGKKSKKKDKAAKDDAAKK
jgi:competence protein ComEA